MTTANVIQGTAPNFVSRLEADIEAGENFELFGLKDEAGRYFTQLEIDGALSRLNLDPKVNKPLDILSAFSIALGTPTTSEATDTDGDSFDELGGTGVTLKWYKAGTSTALTDGEKVQTFCQLVLAGGMPKLIAEGAVELRTTYGLPRAQTYPNGSSVTQTPKRLFDYQKIFDPVKNYCISPSYAKPDMYYAAEKYDPKISSMWNTSNGFLVQSTTDYSKNFPTMGANGLYFDLIVAGVNASSLTWSPITVGNITASMTTNSDTPSLVKVTLTGPDVPKNASNIPTSNIADVPSILPATFELIGKNGSISVVRYGFTIQKWFINRGGVYDNADNQANWCSKLTTPNGKYVLPKISDLTNASGTADNYGGAIPAIPPPYSSGNYYQRLIGGGFFSEWGKVSMYNGANFPDYRYYFWTSHTLGTDNQFTVNGHYGLTYNNDKRYNDYVVCTQP